MHFKFSQIFFCQNLSKGPVLFVEKKHLSLPFIKASNSVTVLCAIHGTQSHAFLIELKYSNIFQNTFFLAYLRVFSRKKLSQCFFCKPFSIKKLSVKHFFLCSLFIFCQVNPSPLPVGK